MSLEKASVISFFSFEKGLAHKVNKVFSDDFGLYYVLITLLGVGYFNK